MSRLALFTALVVAAGCGKSAANQDTGSSAPEGAAGPKKIAVPGMDPKPGSGAETAQFKGGSATPSADERFKLKANEGKLAIAAADLKAGAEGAAKITVTPGEGFHVNTEYPIHLVLTPPSGVTLAKTEFSAGGSDKAKGDAEQLDEKALILSVKMTAAAAGTYTINGTFKFAVCDHDQCLAKKEQIAIAVASK